MGSCRRLLVWVLSATLAVGLPAFAPYVMAADEPCSMSHEEGNAPERDTNCMQCCAALCAGLALPAIQTVPAQVSGERAVAFLIELFQSRAGPPGLQPPR